jgi:hypothetical protein
MFFYNLEAWAVDVEESMKTRAIKVNDANVQNSTFRNLFE